MTPRRIRLASILMLALSLSDTLLAACSPETLIRRPEEDAMLLLIAGDYQLMGELPALPADGVSKGARLNRRAIQPPEPTTPNEAWTLLEYYRGLRDDFERKAKAENLPPDVVAKGIAEYEAKMNALGEKANELDRRRGRHRRSAVAQERTTAALAEGENYQLPKTGTMRARCPLPPSAQCVVDWCPTVQGTLTTNKPLTVTIDCASGTFTFDYMVACEGLKKTDSLGTWIQNLCSDQMQGSGTVYEDGWLLGQGAGVTTWIEQGTWWDAGNVVPINKVKEDSGTVPVAILLDTPDDRMAFELGWGAGRTSDGPPGTGFTIEQAREVGWEDLLGLTPACTTCVSQCEVTSGP
jgi:hypothetical protein